MTGQDTQDLAGLPDFRAVREAPGGRGHKLPLPERQGGLRGRGQRDYNRQHAHHVRLHDTERQGDAVRHGQDSALTPGRELHTESTGPTLPSSPPPALKVIGRGFFFMIPAEILYRLPLALITNIRYYTLIKHLFY